MMTAREYLGQYLIARKRITKLQGELRSLRDLCDQVTVDPTSEKVQSSGNKDRLGNVIAKIVDKEAEINEQVGVAFDLMNEIEECIDMLEDPDEQLVLQMKYIECKSWEEVINSLAWSERSMFRKYREAMDKMDLIVKNIDISM